MANWTIVPMVTKGTASNSKREELFLPPTARFVGTAMELPPSHTTGMYPGNILIVSLEEQTF